MRSPFPVSLEAFRRNGPRGANYGEFVLCDPESGQTLYVIVGGGCEQKEWAEMGLPGEPWEHVSVSRRNKLPPTWDQMCHVKRTFFDDEEWVVQYHPAKSKYINVHPGVLHLWRPCLSVLPIPPVELV
jgi:hypothetical protein